MNDFNTLQKDWVQKALNASDLATLEEIRVTALGRKGVITAQMKALGTLDKQARIDAGKALNQVKQALLKTLENRKQDLAQAELEAHLLKEQEDITLPCAPILMGRIHPLTQVYDEVLSIFGSMGFQLAQGPDVEDDFHNFTALNFPKDHPAREMQDTFFLQDKEGNTNLDRILRTHTSPVQIRTLETTPPPVRVLIPGRTYRSDYDITHTPMFSQVEGLVIDKDINFSHLKGCLEDFCRAFFEVKNLKLRFRSSFFPFTEPSAEIDINYTRKDGVLHVGQGDQWLEILGSGMVHPNVLKACKVDPNEFQGFAFGMGLERIAMLKYGIPDLRDFFEGDAQWLTHYGFAPLGVASLLRGLSPA